jgi:hypothetical protein
MVTLTLIRERKHGSPTPFVLQMRDKTTLRVIHPERMAIGGRFVHVIGKDDGLTSVEASQIVGIKEEKKKRYYDTD